jgi:hypothetical protein
VRIRLELAFLFLIVAVPASAQRGPQLEVSVLAANSPPAGASVRVARLLNDRQMRELLVNGFPAALRFRLELWRAGGLFDDLESTTQWEVLVRYDPYSQQYSVVRLQGIKESANRKETEILGGLSTLEAAEAVIDEPFPVALKPTRTGARYYYNVVLDVETLSVTDLDELQHWLNGEFQPAVRGKRAPLSALRRGIGTLLSRVLGGEKHHYEARSVQFRT